MAVQTLDIELGSKAPSFSLLNTVNGDIGTLEELKSDTATVVMFICNHCPYVVHIHQQLVELANEYIPKGVSFIGISSNSIVTHPQDGPKRMAELAEQLNFPFPYLYDETQDVARAYHAACTPDFSIFNGDLNCVYRGALDGSIPGNDVPVTGEDMRNALDNILSGQPVNEVQRQSIGCSIKWHP
ncbi:MAG: thioredoxin family protein [Flavobacteriales bacterium]|nr:thioredoxin family protein [Flavobacteriales bacterium]